MPKGSWTPPDAGDNAPQEVKDILKQVYSDFRDKNPAENPETKAKGAQIAWGAVKNAGWKKDSSGKWVKSKSSESVLESNATAFKLIEAKSDKLVIDVHIISPGWGSSGYYSEAVLRKACLDGVYPTGMHMHIDHPTREAEKNHPARTLKGDSPLAAILSETGHYESDGWDKTPENPTGAGVYALGEVLPSYSEDIKALDGHAGISHYVDGIREQGEAEGRKGLIVRELTPSPLNTVDFVTVAGRGGSYRTLSEALAGIRAEQNNEQKTEESMTDKKMTLKEVMESYPEIVTELKDQIKEEFGTDAIIKEQATKLSEATKEIKSLKEQLTESKRKLAENEARKYLAEEISKAKLPDASVKVLVESLLTQVPLKEDGTVDQTKFAETVKAAVESKIEEVKAIQKESGIKGNGGGSPAESDADHEALVESFAAIYRSNGESPERAKQKAEIAAGGR